LWPALAVLSDGVYVAGGMNTSTVLASVERLAWSDLGITGPIDLDGGVGDGPPPDSATSCTSDDAGVGRDAAPDGGQPADGALDVSQSDGATDTSVEDADFPGRESGGGKSGCSCSFDGPVEDSLASVVLACLALGVALQRRSRARGGGWTVRSAPWAPALVACLVPNAQIVPDATFRNR